MSTPKPQSLHILYLMQFYGDPAVSWASGRSYDFANHWAEQPETRVTVITSDAYDVGRKSDLDDKDSKNESLNIIRVRQRYQNKMGWLRRVLAFLQFWVRAFIIAVQLPKYEVIYASSTPFTVPILGMLLKKLTGAKLIVEHRDLWPDFPIEVMRPAKSLNKILRWTEMVMHRFSDEIVVLSPDAKKVISARTETPVHMYPNGCSLYPRVRETRKRRDRVIYTGALGWANDVPQIVQICDEIINNTRLDVLIVGEGTDKELFYQWKMGLLEENRSRVDISSYVPREVIIKEIAESAFSICTFRKGVKSLRANSPNKLFDSIAVGTPVIISAEGYLEDLLKRFKIGINYAKNVQLSTEIENLYSQKQQYDELCRNCLTLAGQLQRTDFADRLFYTIIRPTT